MKRTLLATVALICSFMELVSAQPTPDEAVAVRERVFELIKEMRPPHINYGPPVRTAFDELMDLGDRAYPALAEALAKEDRRWIIDEILALFSHPGGDKAVAIKAVKDLIERSKLEERGWRNIRGHALETLGRIGGTGEIDVLLAHVESADMGIRVWAAEGLAMLADKTRIAEQLETIAAERRKRNACEHVKDDPSVREMEKAVREIRARARPEGGAERTRSAEPSRSRAGEAK